MATDRGVVDFLLEQIGAAGSVRARAMFGEYGVYCDEKLVALICDDQLFVKPTAAGRAFAGPGEEAPPYPGAKPYLLVPGDKWDDREWLTSLIQLSAAELPVPKQKSPRRARA